MSGSGLSAWVCLLLMLMTYSSVVRAHGSFNKRFILGFTESGDTDPKFELIIATLSVTPVKVRVTLPLLDPTWKAIVTVTRAISQTVTLPTMVQGNGTRKDNKGIFVKATRPVSVFGVSKSSNNIDKYMALPVKMLGREYYTVTYKTSAQFMIVATKPRTKVTITLPNHLSVSVSYGGQSYGAGDVFSVILDRYQTFQLVLSVTPGQDVSLTGTHIVSKKRVAVLSGSQPSFYHLVEMLLPVNLWGMHYCTAHTPNLYIGDYFIFVASESNTTVTIGSHTTQVLADAGDFWVYQKLHFNTVHNVKVP